MDLCSQHYKPTGEKTGSGLAPYMCLGQERTASMKEFLGCNTLHFNLRGLEVDFISSV